MPGAEDGHGEQVLGRDLRYKTPELRINIEPRYRSGKQKFRQEPRIFVGMGAEVQVLRTGVEKGFETRRQDRSWELRIGVGTGGGTGVDTQQPSTSVGEERGAEYSWWYRSRDTATEYRRRKRSKERSD